ncbi:MAG: hypothetical protein CM1200mP30_31840 [Pseudomonadota bacterium]|nr:MAG: hypothetical protein CM1200mP30_31840 [Pseudomonadota bacterium]
MIRLADANSMREMDRHEIEDMGTPVAVLMENAARSVADWVEKNKLKMILKQQLWFVVEGKQRGEGLQ